MTGKMHAAVVEQFGKPLVLQEHDIPVPGPGQILVKTEACGVCHTDLHAAHGDWPVKPDASVSFRGMKDRSRAGVGAGVTIVKEGDRVGVPWLYSACGHCEYCLSAWETVCPDAQFGGYTKNGGFADYLIADPNYVAHIPHGLGPRRKPRRSSVPASPPTRASRKPAQGRRMDCDLRCGRSRTPGDTVRQGHGSRCRSARSTSTTASWNTPRAWAPISSKINASKSGDFDRDSQGNP
jgi:hypothetical protein